MHFVRYKAVTKYTLGIKVSVMTPEPFVFFSVQQKGQRNLSADREDHSFGSEIDQNTTRREGTQQRLLLFDERGFSIYSSLMFGKFSIYICVTFYLR